MEWRGNGHAASRSAQNGRKMAMPISPHFSQIAPFSADFLRSTLRIVKH